MNLPNCPICGASGTLRPVQTPTSLRMGARSAVVPVEREICTECGEAVVTPEQMRTAQVALVDELRRQDNLLAPAAIRSIRTKFGLTQAELEIVFGVAPKTAVRWERGTVCQSRAIDQLLRLADAVPGALAFLAERAGIQLPQPARKKLAVGGSVIPFPAPNATQTFAFDALKEMPKISSEALK